MTCIGHLSDVVEDNTALCCVPMWIPFSVSTGGDLINEALVGTTVSGIELLMEKRSLHVLGGRILFRARKSELYSLLAVPKAAEVLCGFPLKDKLLKLDEVVWERP